jgi:hypothetical protein
MGDTEDNTDRSLPWSIIHRRALLVIFSAVLVYLVYVTMRDRVYVPDPLPPRSPLADRLADRIDPNTADVATLAALPGLGEKRAMAIVAFREKVQQREPGAIAFQGEFDLLKIRGIGAAMVENLRPYLMFPPATTRPVP